MAWSLRHLSTRTGTIIVVAILAAMALALWLTGQPGQCPCGYTVFWVGDIWSDQNSQQMADPYTFTHIVHGVLFFWALAPFAREIALAARLIIATLVEASWEILENTDAVISRYRDATISLGYSGDSVVNSSFDVLFCLLGFAVAYRISGRLAAFAVVATEVALTVTVRDSLVLNVVMLLYPVEAIREWQLGR